MSNQHKNALHHAADELRDNLERYGIQVDAGERMIVWRGNAVSVTFGTTKKQCLRILRAMISEDRQLIERIRDTRIPLL